MWPSPPIECSSVQGFVLARGAESWQRPQLRGARGADTHARSCSPALAHAEGSQVHAGVGLSATGGALQRPGEARWPPGAAGADQQGVPDARGSQEEKEEVSYNLEG